MMHKIDRAKVIGLIENTSCLHEVMSNAIESKPSKIELHIAIMLRRDHEDNEILYELVSGLNSRCKRFLDERDIFPEITGKLDNIIESYGGLEE